MNTEHEFCFTIKLKQNNSRDLKDVLHAQETFCRYFRHTKTHAQKKQQQQKKTYQNKKYPTTKTKYKKTKIKNQTKQQNTEKKKKKNKGNKETCK